MDARLSGSSSRTLARFCNDPVERSSRIVTRLRPLSRSTRWDPMKPAPPVMRMRRPSMAPRRRDERAISVPVSNEASAGYMGELRTDVEESPRNRRILCGTRRSTDLLLCEVFSGDPFDLRGRREEDWRLRSLLRALEEHPNESHDGRCASHAEVRPDDPGMTGVHRDAGSGEPRREAPREQDLRDARLVVRAESAVALLPLEV